MNPRTFASVSGVLLLIVGVLAMIPSMVGPMNDLPRLYVENSYGLFMGFMPLNILNKVAMVLVGLGGIYASRSLGRELPYSIAYSRIVFALMGTMAILGLVPATNTLFGYWPLFGYNSPVAGVLSLLGAYFGYALSLRVPADRTGAHPTRESLVHT